MNLLQHYQTKTVVDFNIQYLQFLDETGKQTQALPSWTENEATILGLYKDMVLSRELDQKAIKLQRTGKLGTYPPSIGQEALFTGIGDALLKDDVFCGSYRELGTWLKRGVPAENILAIWGGNEWGNHFKKAPFDTPITALIAAQFLHAAGIAYAAKYKRKKEAILVVGGDGATSKGEFYEMLNIAGLKQLPLVCVINNNCWAISTHCQQQTAAKTFAQKGIAGGIDSYQVDGNDIIAVKEITSLALNKARSGQGPTLIEALTFRLSDHTTVDDATRYCDAKLREDAWKKEPIKRFFNYLVAKGSWDKAKEQTLKNDCVKEVDAIVKRYESFKVSPPTDIFDYLYEILPISFQDQREKVDQNA